MAQINAGVSFKGRLPQIVGQAALAASVLAGGASLLNAGGAMADPCFSEGTFDVTPLDSNFTATCPIVSGGAINTLAVDYDPPGVFGGTGTYAFDVKTLVPPNPGRYFKEVGLGVDVNGIGTYSVEVMKEVFTKKEGGTLLGTLKLTQTNLGSSYTGDLLLTSPYIYESLYIKDSYSVTGTAVGIDKITNTFESVPGPLPILGAGAAFGFSRKLRSRIKAGRTA